MSSFKRKGAFSFLAIIFLLWLAAVIILVMVYLRIEVVSGSLEMQKIGLRYAAESGGNYALSRLSVEGAPQEDQVWHLDFPKEQASSLEVLCRKRANGCQIISIACKDNQKVKIHWLVEVEKIAPYYVKVREVRG